MKPLRILYFIIYVLISLAFISLIFPSKGVKVNNDIQLHFPKMKELFFPERVEYADISNIVNTNPDLDTLSVANTQDSTAVDDTISIDEEELLQSLQFIEFPDGKKTNLHAFFQKLSSGKSKGQIVRIMHYGDSQIEGDRITSFVRAKLQYAFGGYGVGLFPVIDVAPSFSYDKEVSSNWKRYPGFGKKDAKVLHKRYGVLASFCRYGPLQNDSVFNDSNLYESWIKLGASKRAYGPSKHFDQCRIFYGNNKKDVTLETYADDILIKKDTLKANQHFAYVQIPFPKPPQTITLKFSGKDSPDIYGISLDGNKGLAVDNIPLRGSSGTIFNAMEFNHLKKFYSSLHTELLILQFGGNVMPYINEDKKVKNYGRWFYSNLITLKRLNPGVSIIVIGMSDMSVKEKEKYITYPNLEKVRDALKEAAFKAGCAYWDMYEAMGGKNSMPSWVFSDPPLASKDFIHFQPQGARIIANMFYNAFIFEYNDYKKSLTPKTVKSSHD